MTIKKMTSIAIGAGLLLSVVSPVFAQSSSPSSRKGILDDMKEARKEARCSVATTRIDERIKFYTDHKEDHAKRYSNIKERVSRVINILKGKGVDVTKLQTDLTTLDSKIKIFNDAVVAFQAKLEATKSFNCGNSEGQFKAAVKEAQAARQAVFAAAKDVQSFFTGTILPDIKAVRASMPKASAE